MRKLVSAQSQKLYLEAFHSFFGVNGQTVVIASATAIPSDTSRNRCQATIERSRVCGINKTMLKVIAANR